MVTKSQSDVGNNPQATSQSVPTAAQVASQGLQTTRNYAQLAGALCNDLLNGIQTGKVGNAVVRSAHMGLRAIDLEHKHNDGKPIDMS